jgi:AraC-like DNA-binding protein
MSKKRQAVHLCPRLPAAVTALSFDLSHGHTIPEHMHPEDQLVYACAGVMTVRTTAGTWVVPAQRAVWIPAFTAHSIRTSGAVSMRTIYLRGRMVRHLPRTCCVVNVSPLLQHLIVHLCTVGKLNRRSKTQAHLIDVLIDQLEMVKTVALQLPSLSDARAARVAAELQQNASEASLEHICSQAGASKRTIERLFRQETKLSLGKWRQQLRLLRSLELLASGEKISSAALEAGYSTPSAFIAMFRKALGTTPRRYFEDSAGQRFLAHLTGR